MVKKFLILVFLGILLVSNVLGNDVIAVASNRTNPLQVMDSLVMEDRLIITDDRIVEMPDGTLHIFDQPEGAEAFRRAQMTAHLRCATCSTFTTTVLSSSTLTNQFVRNIGSTWTTGSLTVPMGTSVSGTITVPIGFGAEASLTVSFTSNTTTTFRNSNGQRIIGALYSDVIVANVRHTEINNATGNVVRTWTATTTTPTNRIIGCRRDTSTNIWWNCNQ